MEAPTAPHAADLRIHYRVFSDILLELWAPRGPRSRLALTTTGVAEVSISDRFDEQILDLHWQEVAAYLSTGNSGRISEFAGLVIDGRTLASTRDGVAACLRMAD